MNSMVEGNNAEYNKILLRVLFIEYNVPQLCFQAALTNLGNLGLKHRCCYTHNLFKDFNCIMPTPTLYMFIAVIVIGQMINIETSGSSNEIILIQ